MASADTIVTSVPSPGDDGIAAVVRSAAVQSLLAEDAATFGGAYIDSNDGRAVWVVGFTADAAAHEQELVRVLPLGFPLRVWTVQYTWASLEALSRQVVADEVGLERAGVQVITVGPSAQTNRVVVGVTSGPADAAQLLAQRYGPAVTVERVQPALPIASPWWTRNLWAIAVGVILVAAAVATRALRRTLRHRRASGRAQPAGGG